MEETRQAKKIKALFPHSRYTYGNDGNIAKVELNLQKHLTSEIIIDDLNLEVKVINHNPVSDDLRFWQDLSYKPFTDREYFIESDITCYRSGIISFLENHISALNAYIAFSAKIECTNKQFEDYADHLIHGILTKLDKAGLLKSLDATNCDDLD